MMNDKGTEQAKMSEAEYKRQWRLKTGRTKQIGHVRGKDHPAAKLVGKVRAKALRLLKSGRSNRFVASKVGVTEGSIRKFREREGLS